jgi:hypothetical protein
MLALRRVFHHAGMLRKALSVAYTVLTFFSIGFVRAASTQVDPNGNAPPEAEVAGVSEDQAAKLAKKLQNPVASLISTPFQNNFDFNFGTNDGFRYILDFQPVIPLSPAANLCRDVSHPLLEAWIPVSWRFRQHGLYNNVYI